MNPKQAPIHLQPPTKDPPPHPTPATPGHTPPQRPWGGKMGAPSARRPPPVAPIFPPHGRCGGVCRGVAGVGCGGGSSGDGLGWFGDCFGSVWGCSRRLIWLHLDLGWGPSGAQIRRIRDTQKYVNPRPEGFRSTIKRNLAGIWTCQGGNYESRDCQRPGTPKALAMRSCGFPAPKL